MAINQGGRQFTYADLQRTAGDIATNMRDSATRAMQFKAQLETWPDSDLILLGLTQEQINAIKGYYVGDAPAIYDALVASVWIKQLLGLGV